MTKTSDGFRLPSRVDFDREGPRIGRVRLLRKTVLGFVPRSSEEIETLCREECGYLVDATPWTSRLPSIASAMNAGDLPLAAIATSQLSLRIGPADEEQDLFKARVGDPKHPGYPGGSPNHEGGEFRPKDASASEGGAPTRVETNDRAQRIKRLTQRRSFRSILGRVLTIKRALRMVGRYIEEEVVQDIPVANDVVGAASFTDDLDLMMAMSEDVADSEAAIEFAKKGPVGLSELQQSPGSPQAFTSFDAFKKSDVEKRFGPAGDGYDYPHLVEQSPNAGVITAEQLQSTDNIVRIPRLIHEEINAIYAREDLYGGRSITPREFLRGKSFAEQREFAIQQLRKVGAIY